MTRETSGNAVVSTGNRNISGGNGPLFTNNLRSGASAAVGVLFCAQEAQKRPRTAASTAAAQTSRHRKTPENPRKYGIFRGYLQMGATQHRPGSHSSRPKRTGAVALDDSIADGGPKIKGRGRANGALERANFAAKWPFSAPISERGGPCAGRARRAFSGIQAGTIGAVTMGQFHQNGGTMSH